MSEVVKVFNNLIDQTNKTSNIFKHTSRGFTELEIQNLVKELKVQNYANVPLTRFLQNLALSQQATMLSLNRISDALAVILKNDHMQETNNEDSKD